MLLINQQTGRITKCQYSQKHKDRLTDFEETWTIYLYHSNPASDAYYYVSMILL